MVQLLVAADPNLPKNESESIMEQFARMPKWKLEPGFGERYWAFLDELTHGEADPVNAKIDRMEEHHKYFHASSFAFRLSAYPAERRHAEDKHLASAPQNQTRISHF